jgi:hypothetical protein
MTKIEQILFGLTVSGGIGVALSAIIYWDTIMIFFWLTNLSLITLMIYYIAIIDKSFWTVVIALMILRTIGYVFSVLHLTGGYVIELIGLSGIFILSTSIILTYRHQFSSDFKYYIFFAGLIFVQGLLYLHPDHNVTFAGRLMNILIVGIIGTIKLKNIRSTLGLDKILNLFLAQGLITIFFDTIGLLK